MLSEAVAVPIVEGFPLFDDPLRLAELRRRVAANYEEIDTRNIQFHLFRMQLAGVIETTREEGQAVAPLLKDVSLALRDVKT